MKLSERMIKFIEEKTDDNGYMAICPTNRVSKNHAILVRFCNEETWEWGEEHGENRPVILLMVDLKECEISGAHVYGVFQEGKKNE